MLEQLGWSFLGVSALASVGLVMCIVRDLS
jgi:hypothetical protein